VAGAPNSKAEYVAQRLLDRIVTSNLGVGANIGTEAELLGQYDVSRPTLRESLRILESQGVLSLRPGPKGGIMVSKPGTDILAHGLSVYLRMHDIPLVDVLKARAAIEPALAAEAAQLGDNDDFEQMQASIEQMKSLSDPVAFAAENRQFHALVARAARNRVMEIFWATVSIVANADEQGIQFTPSNQKLVITAHQGIVDACRARDAGRASDLMEEHVRDLEQLVRKSDKYLLNQATSIVARQGRNVG
jgi:GntR family transcriptional repressor for pyruvate dehydrogenase complex|tara:strand:+ start:22180 stop:22923 length:744 start_codon:yes stop_codon:yes gene_type:complete